MNAMPQDGNSIYENGALLVNSIDVNECNHPDTLKIHKAAKLIDEPHVLIIKGTVSGTIPQIFMDSIRQRTENGLPTFVVSTGYTVPNGNTAENYENHDLARDAGAILLKKLNAHQIGRLEDFVLRSVLEGKRGDELITGVQAFNDAHPEVVRTVEVIERDTGELLTGNI